MQQLNYSRTCTNLDVYQFSGESDSSSKSRTASNFFETVCNKVLQFLKFVRSLGYILY